MPKIRQSFVVFAVGVLCLLQGAQGRSISMIGDIKIEITDTQFLCDKIECPTNANRCEVSKIKDPQNSTVLVRSNICYSSTNEVLKNTVTKETIDANAKVHVHIEANRNGMISMSNSYNSFVSQDFDAEKFNKEFTQEMSEFQNNLNRDMQNLNNQLSQMGQQLGNLFH